MAKMDKNKKRINLNNQFLEQAVFAIADGIFFIKKRQKVLLILRQNIGF